MYTRTTTVINETGIHARPASDFIAKAKTFSSKITIANLDAKLPAANAKSIITVLTQAMVKGTRVELTAEGEDEKEAVDALVALIDSGFGE